MIHMYYFYNCFILIPLDNDNFIISNISILFIILNTKIKKNDLCKKILKFTSFFAESLPIKNFNSRHHLFFYKNDIKRTIFN